MGAVSSKMKVGYTGCLELLGLLNGPRGSWAGECVKELETDGIPDRQKPCQADLTTLTCQELSPLQPPPHMQCQDNEFALKWEKLRLEAVGGEIVPPPSSLTNLVG